MVVSARKGGAGGSRAKRADYRHVGAMVVRRAHLAVATHTMAVEAMTRRAGDAGAADAARGRAVKGVEP